MLAHQNTGFTAITAARNIANYFNILDDILRSGIHMTPEEMVVYQAQLDYIKQLGERDYVSRIGLVESELQQSLPTPTAADYLGPLKQYPDASPQGVDEHLEADQSMGVSA